ncbi:hypothetical protein FXO37_17122 [Capsicum annuum]|nr:hypothetical protein FXO37_17122 [Capsicum annuum]
MEEFYNKNLELNMSENLLWSPPAFALEYETHVGGESSASFHKESGQTREDSQNLRFEEAAQTQKSTNFGEEFGTASTGVEEEVGGVSGGRCGRDSTGIGEEVGVSSIGVGASSAATASEFPIIESDWESASENSEDSGYEDLFDETDDEYGSDVHGEVRTLREGKRAVKLKNKKKCPRAEVFKLGKKGVDIGYDEYLSRKNTLKDKIGGDELYFDSDEEASFEIDSDVDVNVEDEV